MEKVLIIETDEEIQDFLKVKLTDYGFEYDIASNIKQMKDLYNQDKQNYIAILAMELVEIIDYLTSFNASIIILANEISPDNYRFLNRADVLSYSLKTQEEELDYAVGLIDKMRYYSTLNALSVDDSATARMIVARQLKLLKFNLFEATDGIQALEVLKKESIDLVITDFNMPNMDGLELTLNIRKKYSKNEIVIVALTAVDTPENTTAFLKYGASGFIAKPLSKETFNYTVNNAMELNRSLGKNVEYTNTIDENVLSIKVDEDFIIVDVSKAFLNQSGYTKQNLIGSDYSILFEDNEVYTNIVTDVLASKQYKNDIVGITNNKERCHYKATVMQVLNKRGQMEGLLDIREDITDTVLMQQQQESLFEQSKFNAMGSLLKNIAHQWRQPLNVITLQLEGMKIIAEDGELDEEFVDMVYDQTGEQIAYLTDTITLFSSYFSGNDGDEDIDIIKLFEDTSKILVMYLEDKNIKISVSGDSFNVRGNKDKLSQVFLNLINNSVESIEKKQESDKNFIGNIIIKAYKQERKLEVIDNGIGIKEEIQDKIFDPYFTTKFKDRGVGLSLYLSKIIIEQNLNGKLDSISVQDGASFLIKF